MNYADDLESIAAPSQAPSQPTDYASELEAIAAQPKAPPQTISQDAALGSTAENFLAGMGKAVVDMGRGAKQIIDVPAKWLETKFPGISQWSQSALGMPSAAQSAAQTNKDVADSRKTDAALLSNPAGAAGDVVGNIASMVIPLGGAEAAGSTLARSLLNPRTYKAAAAAGALQGALQPVTGDESRTQNAVLGAGAGIAGNAAVSTVGRVAQPVARLVSAAHDKAVQVLDSAGIPLDAAQRTGSTFLGKLRSSFSDNPFTAGAQADFSGAQKAAYNRAVLKTIGEDATSASPEVMNAADKRIDGVFKDVLDRNSVNVNDSLLARIGQIQKAANEEEKKPVSAIANRFMDSVGEDGTVPGQIAYNVKKDLDRLANSSDTTLAYHAKQLRSAVMDGIQSSLGDQDRVAFAQARGQFANMKKIEDAVDRTGSGDISPAKLANVFYQKRNRNISIYGRGPQDLYDLAQAGNMLMPDRTPNSGSTARAMMQIGLPILAGSAVGGVEGYRDYSHGAGAEDALLHGVGTALTVGAAPRMAQYLMQSPSVAKYAASGIRGAATPLRDLLLLPNSSALAGAAARRVPVSALVTKSASSRP